MCVRERPRQTDRQTDRQTYIHTDRQTDRGITNVARSRYSPSGAAGGDGRGASSRSAWAEPSLAGASAGVAGAECCAVAAAPSAVAVAAAAARPELMDSTSSAQERKLLACSARVTTYLHVAHKDTVRERPAGDTERHTETHRDTKGRAERHEDWLVWALRHGGMDALQLRRGGDLVQVVPQPPGGNVRPQHLKRPAPLGQRRGREAPLAVCARRRGATPGPPAWEHTPSSGGLARRPGQSAPRHCALGVDPAAGARVPFAPPCCQCAAPQCACFGAPPSGASTGPTAATPPAAAVSALRVVGRPCSCLRPLSAPYNAYNQDREALVTRSDFSLHYYQIHDGHRGHRTVPSGPSSPW